MNFTGRLLDIRAILKLSQGNVCAGMVSELDFYIKKFSYKSLQKI